jgi:hypothetical protein
MKVPISFLLVSSAALSAARPFAARSLAAPLALRTVSSLDQAATAEAQQKDNTATRAFTGQPIKTSDGKCWTIDPLSGDFRENLTPVQLLPCNGSDGQKWDVITSGKHDNVAGTALIVSSLTNACLNFDDRRAAGDKVILFSCGGRADGGGQVTDSQLFGFNGFQGPFTLVPRNKAGTCMSVNGARLDEATCNNSAGQTFTIGNGASSGSNTPPPSNTDVNNGSGTCGAASSTTTVVVTVTEAATTSAAAQTTAAPPTTNNNQVNTIISNPILDPSKTVSVSRAGGVLNPTAAAQANTRDDTATRAFSNVQLKSANGQCLFIDPTAGDFRENLIPVQVKSCDNSDNEKFDIITAGKHNNAKNSMLIVSSLTQGCLNFDDRRAAGDQVIMFSCGGRADGEGQTTDSQLFPFTGSSTIVLAPENAKNQTCLVPKGSLLDVAACTGGNDQVFTIVGGGAAAPPPQLLPRLPLPPLQQPLQPLLQATTMAWSPTQSLTLPRPFPSLALVVS